MNLPQRLFAIALVSTVGLLPGSHALAQSYPPSVSQLVAAAKQQIKTIDLPTFKAAFDRNDLGLIIDVREPDEFSGGHIPGAINLPRGIIELKVWAYVGFPDNTDMKTKITLYCGTGTRCALAAKSLQDLGFTNISAADMKLDDWVKAGYPLLKK